MKPSISPLGDRGITISVGEGISLELSETAVALAESIRAASIRGVTDVVPSYTAIGVFFEPLEISYPDLSKRLERVFAEHDETEYAQGAPGRLIQIDVVYDGEDLDDVARRTRLSHDDVIAIHSEREYRVFVVGFVPGWAYLGILDPRLIVPRRESPRKRVPPGAVAIAEAQTGVYPSVTPGGWNLIGTTKEKMFDASSDSPALLRVGDRVRFVPVS